MSPAANLTRTEDLDLDGQAMSNAVVTDQLDGQFTLYNSGFQDDRNSFPINVPTDLDNGVLSSGQPEYDIGDALDFLWRDLSMNTTLPPFPFDYPNQFISLSDYQIGHSDHGTRGTIRQNSQDPSSLFAPREETGALSRYASRLPSPLGQDAEQSTIAPSADVSLHASKVDLHLPWRISASEYSIISAAIMQNQIVLPSDFKLPSRHAFSRYVEGYFSGFHEHQPFLHIPTFSMVVTSPELALAIAGIGALYRFQRPQAEKLYQASKALFETRFRQHNGLNCLDSVGQNLRVSPAEGNQTFSAKEQTAIAENVVSMETRVEMMQTTMLLVVFTTWNHSGLIKDSVCLAEQLALLAREDGLKETEYTAQEMGWRRWAMNEGRRRTKITAYCYLNLHSLVYNSPPKMTNNEIELNLPCPESWWKAMTEEEWTSYRANEPCKPISFRDGYSSLLSETIQSSESTAAPSSFGNYAMIHCLLQHIFFLRQATVPATASEYGGLNSGVVQQMETALRRWQRNWESTKDSTINPSSPNGPLSFNCIALFRIAYIRLHADIGPHRRFDTGNSSVVARSFQDIPHLPRSIHVCRALLQSAHSLSIPVRVGVEYVALTQTLNWSVVHSLCNLECAVFLSKWLNCMGTKTAEGQVSNANEMKLLGLVGSILQEAGLSDLVEQERIESRRYKLMAAAVARLCAQMFKGPHVFKLMELIGASLERYADTLDQKMATISNNSESVLDSVR